MNVYEVVTDRILAQLEAGIIPWRKEWTVTGHSNLPTNYTTKKPYRGINVWLLLSAVYPDARFLTYKQAQAIGAQVRKGEKGTPIIFWSTFDGTEKATNGETIEKSIPFARTYTVFNVSQCDGIPAELPLTDGEPFEPIPAAAELAEGYLQRERIELRHGGDSAFYHRVLDYIQMPAPAAFSTPDAYYSTLFHEAGHSTGAAARLDRIKGAAFGDEAYSKEELCAELCAAYLCAQVGISNAQLETNHAAYIQSWMRALKNDKTLLLSAAQKAQRAADRIANVSAVPAQTETAIAA
jgi:antirestriction protein ArdC